MELGGKKINKWYIIGGLGGAVLVFYLYRRSSAGSSSSASSTSGTDPLTGLPYSQDNSVDPITGMTYLQEAQTYGSVAAADAQASQGSGYGLSGGSGGFGGTAGFPTSNVGPGTAAGQSFATNAAWAQAVQAGLSALGYDPQTVAAALGLFFAQHPLSATQAQIVQAAEAEFGPPPQGTYQIVPAGNGGGTGATPPTGANTQGLPSNAKKYVTSPPGRRSLVQLAQVLHTSTGNIIEMTQAAGGGSLSGQFRTYVTQGNLNAPMPWGMTLYYT